MHVCGDDKGNLPVNSQICWKLNVFKYLESYSDPSRTSTIDMQERLDQFKKATPILHPILWNDKILKEEYSIF